MKAPAFSYVRAESLAHVHELLAQHGNDARLLAGGQSLIPALNMRLASPALLVDINPLSELAGLEAGSERIVLGPLVRLAHLGRSALIAERLPLLARALPHVAHAAIRTRATLGGSIAYADPAAELPACCLALGATFVLASRSGVRRVEADRFFLGLFETALAPQETLIAVELPVPIAGAHFAFMEIARRNGDYATVGLAVSAGMAGGKASHMRLAYFGADRRPRLATKAAACLVDRRIDGDALAEAKRALQDDLDPMADIYHTVQTKRHLAGVVLERTLAQLPLNPPGP